MCKREKEREREREREGERRSEKAREEREREKQKDAKREGTRERGRRPKEDKEEVQKHSCVGGVCGTPEKHVCMCADKHVYFAKSTVKRASRHACDSLTDMHV